MSDPADGPPPSLPRVPVRLSPAEKFREFLEMKGLKATEERLRIVEFIFAEHDHFDADALLDSMKQRGVAASRPTVYRTLALLVDAGLLRQHQFGPRSAYEHAYGYPRHEHLFCEKCKRPIEFVSEELERLLEGICRDRRFRATSHKVVVFGVCEACSKAGARRRMDMI